MTQGKKELLESRDSKIFGILRKHDRATVVMIAVATGQATSSVRERLRQLQTYGWIDIVKKKRMEFYVLREREEEKYVRA